MRIVGGLIKSFLLLPLPLRIVVELTLILIALSCFWIFIKWIPVFLLKILGELNKLMTLINRQLLCIFGKKIHNVYNWDEKIGTLGRRADQRLNNGAVWIKESRMSQILKNKKTTCILIIVYFLAILPSLPLKYIIDEYYLEHLYGINRIFIRTENWAEEKLAKYPPLFVYQRPPKPAADEPAEQPSAEVAEIHSILQLSPDTAYANIRETPEMAGSKIGIVGREDTIVYQNEFSYDNERYWLKVIVESQNNIEGWISANIIESSIVDELNLQ